MMLPWKQIVLLSITGCLAACTEDVIFQGPRWRTEPSDLILPINSPDHQATLTCEAEGSPPPQYRGFCFRIVVMACTIA
ncbi:Contactin-3 [Oryzias melastigma]|uniref:Contactin-3 n=1 Tax=Oryzias melastigma TaxID=30732 RepID=A0A834CHF3_ORYME|nr:Contactin-3 [Oryzias melastigma]